MLVKYFTYIVLKLLHILLLVCECVEFIGRKIYQMYINDVNKNHCQNIDMIVYDQYMDTNLSQRCGNVCYVGECYDIISSNIFFIIISPQIGWLSV